MKLKNEPSREDVELTAINVSKIYGNKTLALDRVNFSIKKGERVCIVGESGSGKTTLAKILCGMIPPTSGEIRFLNKRIDEMSEMERRIFRIKVQYIPQLPDLALDPTWYLYDSLVEPLRIHKLIASKQEERDLVREICEMIGIRMEVLMRKPGNVSGGELQRVVIARAILLMPYILIADEPTSMLDPSLQAKIIKILLDIQSKYNMGMIFITHDLELAKYVSNRIFIMFKGKFVESGLTNEVLINPHHSYTKSLILNNTS
ncbi:MAG: dipeptide/oligopeptide/nickel ABC transporter ATP-binding protein [Candidatus Methanomethyliaceae archaeon]|nr:dipeptide/oligopeptide/nickel ABC transporter ATP-binding protein [Candidatus Methanomethyliaceae archaeon]MDW7970416.1 dipeptide/oligopeptide/nickel ABC transporter ATP-binding protein [Nitrososphaerota archaeon]